MRNIGRNNIVDFLVRLQSWVVQAVVSPAAIWLRSTPIGVHVEIEPVVRIDVFPGQPRQGGIVARCHLSLPMGFCEHLLNHQRVDVNHTVLDQHADFVVLATVAHHLAATGEEHED